MWALIYTILISSLAIIITNYDKSAAINHKWRISEYSLFIIAVMGGAAAMFVTMKIIRHKTKHNKFMIGLPLIVAVQLIYLISIME